MGKNTKDIPIKISIETREFETLFVLLNFDELNSDTILLLDTFAKDRGGNLKYQQRYFYLKKRWDQEYAQRVFDAKGISVEFFQTLSSDTIDNLPLHKQRIHFGKHRGKRWEDLDDSYLAFLVSSPKATQEREYAAIELKRRRLNTPVDQKHNSFDSNAKIGFGKYKGVKWVEIPLSYLQWLHGSLNSSHRDYQTVTKSIEYLQQKR